MLAPKPYGYRLYVLGSQNEWVGDRLRVGITGVFDVPGEYDNGRRLKGGYVSVIHS